MWEYLENMIWHFDGLMWFPIWTGIEFPALKFRANSWIIPGNSRLIWANMNRVQITSELVIFNHQWKKSFKSTYLVSISRRLFATYTLIFIFENFSCVFFLDILSFICRWMTKILLGVLRGHNYFEEPSHDSPHSQSFFPILGTYCGWDV